MRRWQACSRTARSWGGVCTDGSACDVAQQDCADGSPCVDRNHELWSGDFQENCKGGKVDVYVQAAVPADPNPIIKEVFFTHTGPQKNAVINELRIDSLVSGDDEYF
ncbi:MAG: hypothetical protein V3W34_14020, partial [Phycisphaerae bacterium]